MLSVGATPSQAVRALQGREGKYSPALLKAITASTSSLFKSGSQSIQLDQLRAGMVLCEDLHASDGTLVATRGQEISAGSLIRLNNFAQAGLIPNSLELSVRVPSASPEYAAA